jgi:hypothetical protein
MAVLAIEVEPHGTADARLRYGPCDAIHSHAFPVIARQEIQPSERDRS